VLRGTRGAAAHIRRGRRLTILVGAGVSAASGVPTFVWEWVRLAPGDGRVLPPNAAPDVIAWWSARMDGCRVITQNVDDLHVRASTAGLIRLRGSLWEPRVLG